MEKPTEIRSDVSFHRVTHGKHLVLKGETQGEKGERKYQGENEVEVNIASFLFTNFFYISGFVFFESFFHRSPKFGNPIVDLLFVAFSTIGSF